MVLKHLYTLLVVLVGFVIFRADNMGQAFSMIGAMFSGGSASAQTGLLLAQCLTPLTLFALAVGLVGSMPVLPLVCRKAEQQTGSVYACLQALSYAGVLALLLVDILHLSAASYVPYLFPVLRWKNASEKIRIYPVCGGHCHNLHFVCGCDALADGKSGGQ